MKVVLTAFGDRMRSAPMDWPEGTGHEIRLVLDMDGSQWFGYTGKLEHSEPSRPCVGIFVDNNLSEWPVGGERGARIYRLIRVES